MADERFTRWQGQAIAQMSVVVALISAFSVAGLGVGLSLLQDDMFLLDRPFNFAFALSLFLFVSAAFCSFGAVVSRLLDFRLTARKVRKRMDPGYDKPLNIFCANADDYSVTTWRLFWSSCVCLAVGAAVFVVSIGSIYAHRIL